jgi:predicted RNase H-like HicB family nuclease
VAIIKACTWEDENWWIAHGLDVTVATQGGSLAEAMENMSEALSLHLEEPSSNLRLTFHPPSQARVFEVDYKDPQALGSLELSSVDTTAHVALPAHTDEAGSLTFRHLRLKLQAAGFTGISQRPKHAKLIKQEKGIVRTAVLPHYTDLTAAVVRSVLWQAQIPFSEFEKLEAAF